RLAIASTPCGVIVRLSAATARSPRIATRSAGAAKSMPSRRSSTSSRTPAATASRTTRGPSSRTSPGSRRLVRRRSLRTSWLSGLSTSSRLEVVPGNLHQPPKGAPVAHRQFSEHLPVDLYSGLAESVHEPVVWQALQTRGRVDPRDPEPAEVALAGAPVTKRVGQGVQDRLVRRPEQQLPRVAEALGPLQD